MLLGHRYYDPYRARFLTRDPAGYGAGPNLYAFCDGDPINESDPSGLDPTLLSDIGDGFGTGWAGFSTAVWKTPGLSNINRKFSIYSAGGYANQPGFNTSVTLGTIGITILPIPGGAKLTLLAKAANAARLARAAYLAENAGRIRRAVGTSQGLVQATATVSSRGSTLILEDINVALKNGGSIKGAKGLREMRLLTRSVLDEAKKGGFKYVRLKGFRMPGETVNPLRDVDRLIKLR